MTRGSERLEHLFSRYLDGECNPEERELLESLTRNDRDVRRLFEDYRRLDQHVGNALRMAMGRPRRVLPIRRSALVRIGKGLAVAAAACVAALLWLHPLQPAGGPNLQGRPPQQAASVSWFAPAVPQGDTVEPTPSAYERPELRLRGTQRDWIVIPGNQPGTYLVIEVDHVRTHVIGVHQDF